MIKMTMRNGEEVSMEISMAAVRGICNEKNLKKYTDSFFKAMSNTPAKDTADAVFRSSDICYLGYLCNAQEEGTLDSVMDFEEFEKALPPDITAILLAGSALLNPKQTAAFERHLSSEPES